MDDEQLDLPPKLVADLKAMYGRTPEISAEAGAKIRAAAREHFAGHALDEATPEVASDALKDPHP